MRTFFEFTQAPQNQMPPAQGAAPPTPTNGPPAQGQEQEGQDDPSVFEDLSNELQRIIDQKFIPALRRKRLTPKAAQKLIQGLVAQISQHTHISTAAGTKAAKAGMQTNSEPVGSPPMQPQAQG